MDSYAHAADVARKYDRDRYVADLFAPGAVRKHLFALHAFAAEIARIRDAVREPALGEIRLQWWRDAISSGDGAGHPIAEALVATAREFRLPAAAFEMMIEGRIFDLYDDSMPTMNDLEGYAGETSSALLQLGATVLCGGGDVAAADAAGHAGVAETLVRVLRLLGSDAARAAKYVPQSLLDTHRASREDLAQRNALPEVLAVIADLRAVARKHVASAREAIASLPDEVAPVFLPLAVTAAILDRMVRNAAKPFSPVDLAAWRRQWIIWRAARRTRKRS